jgi:uncharacterized protein YndB with AHSA1/START domain
VAEVGRRFTFDARPTLGWIAGEVLEVDPPRLLRCRWSGAFGDTVVAFELTPTIAGTRLRLERLRFWQEYAVELSDDAYGIYNFNWGYYLESLRL